MQAQREFFKSPQRHCLNCRENIWEKAIINDKLIQFFGRKFFFPVERIVINLFAIPTNPYDVQLITRTILKELEQQISDLL